MLGPRCYFLVVILALSVCLRARAQADEADVENPSEVRDKYLVILGAEREFSAGKQEAERVSGLAGVSFSMNGKVWDSNRGLILPDNCQVSNLLRRISAASVQRAGSHGGGSSWIHFR